MMHKKNVVQAGQPLRKGNKVLIMVHGRGGTAEDIISLAAHLDVHDFTLLAPQATNNTWYPYSFMARTSDNEPWLSSALDMLTEIINDLESSGILRENIYFAGFSQGACLSLEFVTRNAARYGGIVAFTGGLIGDKIDRSVYAGDFKQTPVFIGTSNPDPHVPVERVYATSNIMQEMNALVTHKVYNGMGHTINQDEIIQANSIVFNQNQKPTSDVQHNQDIQR